MQTLVWRMRLGSVLMLTIVQVGGIPTALVFAAAIGTVILGARVCTALARRDVRLRHRRDVDAL